MIIGQPELIILSFILLIIIVKMKAVGKILAPFKIFIRGLIIFLTGGGKEKTAQRSRPPVRTVPPQSPAPPLVKDAKTSHKKKVTRKCPNCGAKLTELNFFKLKAGNDTKCDYCDEIILSGS